MKTITASGPAPAPLLTISGGAGNTDVPEIHLALSGSADGQDRSVRGWFNRDELLDAIAEADRSSAKRTRLSEPAE